METEVTAFNRSGLQVPCGAIGIDCNGKPIYNDDVVVPMYIPGASGKTALEGERCKVIKRTATWMLYVESLDGVQSTVRIDCELKKVS